MKSRPEEGGVDDNFVTDGRSTEEGLLKCGTIAGEGVKNFP